MDAEDQGHRYGNFPNYYAFHPPQNRLQVLEETNILSYIRDGLIKSGAFYDPSAADCDGTLEAIAKKPRLDGNPQTQKISDCIKYCDLGCNEGDLTLAMAASLSKEKAQCTMKDGSTTKLSNRRNPIQSENDKPISVPIKCLGLDIDPVLIEKANAKLSGGAPPPDAACENEAAFKNIEEKSKKVEDKKSSNCDIDATFKVCNLCSKSEHSNAYISFMNDNILSRKETIQSKVGKEETMDESKKYEPQQLFHLTTIFSTTMWIHVHSGDEGLREFIERACGWTKKFVLIEPQPSGCYRKANIRLRKMGRPELDDVTSSRLKMRPEIEKEIQNIITGSGFRLVPLDEINNHGDGQSELDCNTKKEAVTSWNRTLHLYERISDK